MLKNKMSNVKGSILADGGAAWLLASSTRLDEHASHILSCVPMNSSERRLRTLNTVKEFDTHRAGFMLHGTSQNMLEDCRWMIYPQYVWVETCKMPTFVAPIRFSSQLRLTPLISLPLSSVVELHRRQGCHNTMY